MNGLPSSRKPNRPALAAAVLACVTLLCAASALAQGGAMSPYQDEKDGVSAGGKWTMFQSEDKMTGAKKVRFELLAETTSAKIRTTSPESICSAKTASSNCRTSIPASGCLHRIVPVSGDSLNWK